MKLKAVIFDLDGTLLNTLADLTASVNAALAAHGLPPRSADDVRTFVGNGYARLIARAVPAGTSAATISAVHAAFQRHYAAHSADATAPYPGTRELLGALRTAGIACAVVSNKGDAAVNALVEHYFAGLVSVAVGERDQVRRKPAPDSTLAVMRALGVGADECAYVGDSEVDVATAAAAGVSFVGVTWGFRSAEELVAAGATTLADTCAELRRTLLLRDGRHHATPAK